MLWVFDWSNMVRRLLKHDGRPQQALPALLAHMDPPDRLRCEKFLRDNDKLVGTARAATYTHHTWPGGYLDHVAASMDFACDLYEMEAAVTPLPFSLSAALVVLFLHDVEKPWKYKQRDGDVDPEAVEFDEAGARGKVIQTYGFKLSNEQENALKYIEGEGDDYTPRRRVMGPLAAFCHMCDVYSARLRPEQPQRGG